MTGLEHWADPDAVYDLPTEKRRTTLLAVSLLRDPEYRRVVNAPASIEDIHRWALDIGWLKEASNG